MDAVYPLRVKRGKLDPLRWSLRSLNLLSSVSRVVLVGGLPDWVNPQAVVHVPTVQGRRKFENIGINLQAVLEAGLSDPFLWFNDDQFILEPWQPVLTTRIRMMDDFVDSLRFTGATDHDDYVRGMRSQRDIMAAWGYDTGTMRCPDNHWPMPVNPTRLKTILKRVQAEYPAHELGHFKAVYAAGLPLNETRDCKVQRPDEPLLDLPVVSTSPGSWTGKAGRTLRSIYSEPSRYEKETS